MEQALVEHWWFVSLASITDTRHLAWAIAQTLGFTDAQRAEQQIQEYLRQTPGLLVLDNFEQVLAGASLIETVLRACPGVKILITSRECLHVRGEVVREVPPLSLPASVLLFQRRVFQVQPQAQLDPHLVEALCRRLEGIPLAIELAAARLQLFSLKELLDRLNHRLQILSGGPTTLPLRQRTLRNTLAWSYDLLSEQEQRLFRLVAVFAGGASIPAIESMCDLLAQPGVLDDLVSLLQKHLIFRQEHAGVSRLHLFEIIQEYALEQGEACGEASILRQAHAHVICQIVQDAQTPEQLDQEQENIRAALSWLFSRFGQPQEHAEQEIATIITHLATYWEVRGLNQEAFTVCMRFLASVEQHNRHEDYGDVSVIASTFALVLGQLEQARSLAQTALHQASTARSQARALLQLGSVEAQRHHFPQAEASLSQAIALFRTTDLSETKGELASALLLLGDVIADRGKEYERPYHLLRESIELFHELGNTSLWGRARHHLSVLYFYHNRLEEAIRIGEQCLSEVEALGFPMPKAYLATWLAAFLLVQPENQMNRAETLLAESLQIFQRLTNRHGVSWALIHRARLAMLQGQQEMAQSDYNLSLDIATEIGDIFLIYHCLDGLAELASLEEAIRLLAEAATIREAADLALPPVYQRYQQQRVHPDELRSHPAWAAGQQAAKQRLEAARFSLELSSTADVVSHLTQREREILVLVARGLQNKEIAASLSVSSRTVEAHLRTIYDKLKVTSRAAAILIAVSLRLG